jgi:hypothetical protein
VAQLTTHTIAEKFYFPRPLCECIPTSENSENATLLWRAGALNGRDQCPHRGRNAAVNRISTEQVLNKAYRLAYFLHQDKDLAIRIVAAATLKLNVAMAVQSKRLYDVPVGRFSQGESRRTNGIRNKALFSDLHLLQRLVYVE